MMAKKLNRIQVVSFSVLSLALVACSATKERASTETVSHEHVAVAKAPPQVQVQAVAAPLPAPSLAATPVAHKAAAPTVDGIDPNKAWGWLKNGNLRFVKQKSLRRDGQSKKDRERLAAGQHPHSVIVSCSDSRVPPELVFDQKLGEIFVIRTAGESMDHGSVASIEYAIEHLGSKLIVVMGHESCGAVKATLETPEGRTAGSPNLDKLVAELRPRLSSFARRPASPGVLSETAANAKGAVEDLMKSSAIIREKVLKGEVMVKTAVYHLGSGQVSWDN